MYKLVGRLHSDASNICEFHLFASSKLQLMIEKWHPSLLLASKVNWRTWLLEVTNLYIGIWKGYEILLLFQVY